MPLLQIDTTLELAPSERTAFTETVTDQYADEMATDRGHVAVVLREHGEGAVHLGRAVTGDRLVVDAEIRQGRPFERKRAFACAVMETVGDRFGVPDPNMKIVFTEHPGEHMMGVDRVGGAWSP